MQNRWNHLSLKNIFQGIQSRKCLISLTFSSESLTLLELKLFKLLFVFADDSTLRYSPFIIFCEVL